MNHAGIQPEAILAFLLIPAMILAAIAIDKLVGVLRGSK